MVAVLAFSGYSAMIRPNGLTPDSTNKNRR